MGGDGGAVDGCWWASRRDSRWVGSAGGLGVPLTVMAISELGHGFVLPDRVVYVYHAGWVQYDRK